MANVDYKAVCQELFGTTDVDELKRLAAQINQKNPRQAGRKKKFKHEMVFKKGEWCYNRWVKDMEGYNVNFIWKRKSEIRRTKGFNKG